MGFRENLKAELAYKDVLVKELATLSGISRRTIDNYLKENGSIPSVYSAVAIAEALGVTVEYLVTGHEERKRKDSSPFSNPWVILRNLEDLNRRDRKIVFSLIKSLKDMENSEQQSS